MINKILKFAVLGILCGIVAGLVSVNYLQKRDLRNGQFGGGNETYLTTMTHSSVSRVASVSTTLLSPSSRQWFRCQNLNPNKSVYLFLGATASKSWGIALTASSSFEMKTDDIWTGPVSAIITDDAASLSARVSCIEGY